ncbi:MAG: HDIG domain-containing protein [Clostridia bacterium]|nr:HDIG domain-containing protein [Clostridia bacterium]
MNLWQDREFAEKLLKEHTKSDSLIKHALSVEAAMRAMARHFGEDEMAWGMVGLLHDLDYEAHPDEHCKYTPGLLREAGYDEVFVRAVLSHGYGLCTDVEPLTDMEKSVFAVDELTGLVLACVYVRPSRSIMDLELKSVRKKWKDKAFAAGCNRQVIADGIERLGMTWDEVTACVIQGMKENAQALGIA